MRFLVICLAELSMIFHGSAEIFLKFLKGPAAIGDFFIEV